MRLARIRSALTRYSLETRIKCPTLLIWAEDDVALGKELTVGTGAEAKPGNTVSVHYTGTLMNGKKFDSSRDRGQPFRFAIGMGQVIAGWDEGVAGMKVGGRRRITIPPHKGYGKAGAGGVIKGNETLVFIVDLLGIG